ncbi:MAG: efflux RND transporter periplasmic adaptor subunit [Acidobacteria bacterium]|nr:efflux RND transporter periplasmic adaptor subunit [Acidobacteriota bacterium]
MRGHLFKMQLAAAWSVLVLASCSKTETRATTPSAPVAVKVETVAAAELPGVYEVSGTVRARYTAAVAAKIVGTIREVRVQAGDRVKAGQILIVLDSRDLEANLRRAEAGLAEAQNAIPEAENAIAAARANLELAQVTHQRFQDLLAKKSVSQQEFDESAARLKGAEAALQISLSKRQQLDARHGQAEAEVAAARIAAGYGTLAAPFAGLVSERKADAGTLATPGAPLLVLEQEGPLRLEASVDESRLRLVRVGQTVPVTLEGLDRTVDGRVAEIAPAVDAATRSFLAKIDLPAVAGLRVGMFGRAAFPAEKRSVLLAPAAAVVERGQIRSLYVVEGDTARLRFVTLGESRGDRREVLAGLDPGEQVILNPPAALEDGARVTR